MEGTGLEEEGRQELGTPFAVGDERGPVQDGCLLTTVISRDLLEQNDIQHGEEKLGVQIYFKWLQKSCFAELFFKLELV